jgi:hypothetical protein
MGKIVFWLLAALAGGYCALLYYPDPLFKHSAEHHGFLLRSAAPLEKPAGEILGKVIERLEATRLYSPDREFKVYLAGPGALYALLTPFCGDGKGCTYGMIDDRIVLPVGTPEEAGVPLLVRQTLYDLLQEKLRPLEYAFLKDWKLEGYAESVGGESVGYTPSAVCGKDDVPEDFRLLLEKRLVVELLMTDEKLGIMALLKGPYAYEPARDRMTRRYCAE